MITILILLALLIILFIASYNSYKHDLQLAIEFQNEFKPKIISTGKGSIEYATYGKGEPVLMVHGASGGFDQGVIFGRKLLNDQFHIIAPSRIGYQHSKTEADFSVAKQADLYVALLDSVGIHKVTVVGFSAGAPSCVDLAIRYPERVAALILIGPLTYSPQPLRNIQKISWPFIFSTLLKWDYPLWLGMHLIPGTILMRIGIPRKFQNALTTIQKHKLMKCLLPFTSRVKGLSIDGKVLASRDSYRLQQITSPTLVITSKDDPWRTLAGAKYTASKIWNSKFICYESGGHLLNGREEDVRFQLVTFILSQLKGIKKDGQPTVAV
jgi:2-hydroxy-6-oxonona-2,4-dienedioate hydrolase